MSLEFHCATDTGRARNNNEDSVAVDEPTALVVLADGMGGYNAGEVASGMATSFIKTELGRWLAEASENATDTDVRRAMDICVDNANRAIFNAANSNPQYAGMGTTLVVCVFRDNRLLVGHVGDSRAYRLRGGRLQQITRDHSLLEDYKEAKPDMTEEEQRNFPHKNVITRALGMRDTVQVDIRPHQIMDGDFYLMCSDGLSGMVEDNHILKIITAAKSLERVVAELVDTANRAGGTDNITTLILQCVAA